MPPGAAGFDPHDVVKLVGPVHAPVPHVHPRMEMHADSAVCVGHAKETSPRHVAPASTSPAPAAPLAPDAPPPPLLPPPLPPLALVPPLPPVAAPPPLPLLPPLLAPPVPPCPPLLPVEPAFLSLKVRSLEEQASARGNIATSKLRIANIPKS